MNKIDMPSRSRTERWQPAGPSAEVAAEVQIDAILLEFVATIRRQFRFVLTVTAAVMVVALLYIAMRPSEYRATTSLLIDPARGNVLQSQQVIALPTVDSGFVDSQVEILKSDSVAEGVVRRLKLVDDPEFNQVGALRALISPVLRLLTGSSPTAASDAERNTVERFQRQISVQRTGMSYIIEIGFTALNPDKSALIANATSEVYLDQQIAARFDATRRASKWLQDRADELRGRLVRSEEAVQSYKKLHNLVEVGGRLLIDQQISDLTGQISVLQAQTSEALVRYNQVGSLIQAGDYDTGAIDLNADGVIGRLRQQASDLARREKELEQRFGATHRLVLDARSEQRSLRRQLEEEFKRLHESLKTTYDIAIQKQQAAEVTQVRLSAEFGGIRDKEIFLRELQRESLSNKQLLETFANRYKEILQQESMPMMDARIVAFATRPVRPSNPRLSLVLLGALMAGLVTGVAAALTKDRIDGTVRRIVDVENDVGRPVLALLEDLEPDEDPMPLRRGALQAMDDTGSGANQDRRLLPLSAGILRHVIHYPLSPFAEAFRSLRVSLSLRSAADQPLVIGITSTGAGEGKSTIASNFAQHLTQSGAKVLLVDGDVRNPSLSRKLRPTDDVGIPDVIAGANWRSLLCHDAMTGLAFLPANSRLKASQSAEFLATEGFKALLNELTAEFDVVVIDLAPLSGTFDARAVAPLVDTFVYVVSWGQVQRKHLERVLQDAPEVKAKISGVVLNRIDAKRFNLFETSARPGYGYRYGYGSDPSRS